MQSNRQHYTHIVNLVISFKSVTFANILELLINKIIKKLKLGRKLRLIKLLKSILR